MMIRRLIVVVILLLAIALVGCDCRKSEPVSETVTPQPQMQAQQYAKHFRIGKQDGFTTLTVTYPWERDNVFRYLLVPRDAKPPDHFDGQIVRTPVRTIVALSTTYLAHLRQLGALDVLVGVSEAKYINDADVLSGIRQGRIKELGMPPNINLEMLIDLAPDLVITYGSGVAEYDDHQRLIESGLPVAMTAEYIETTPLGRVEWLKVLALFLNRTEQADAVFADIEKKYSALKDKAIAATTRPTVFLNSHYQGTWWIPGGKNYMAAYLADAGAEYLWKDDPTYQTVPVDAEVVFAKAQAADFWLNPGTVQSVAELLLVDRRYAAFDAVKNCHVYNYDARTNPDGGNDFWETGMANPHLVLADLIRVLHPELLPDHELIWYRRLPCNPKQ